MGILQNLFSGNQNTVGTTSNNGVSTGKTDASGNTTNTNTSTPFLQWLASQTAGALTPIQSGQTAGSDLLRGSAGITPGQVASFANPQADSIYHAASTALQPQFQDQLSQLKGSLSTNPYASSNGGAEARLRGQQGQTLADLAGKTYQTAWAAAPQLALGSAGLTQGAGSTLGAQQIAGINASSPLINSAGATNTGAGMTNQTGTSSGTTSNTGTSNSTTTYNPSLASIGLGTAGLLLKDGGAVKGYESGGTVAAPGGGSDFASKVRDAFHVFHDMRLHAQNGGKVDAPGKPNYDDGGWVPTVSSYLGGPPSDDSYWNGVQAAAINNGTPARSPYDTSPAMKDRLGTLAKSLEPPKIATPAAVPMPTDNPSLGALSGIMGSVGTALRPRAAEGGVMDNDTPSFASTLWSGLTGAPTEARSTPARDVLRDNYDYEKPDARWQLRRGLLGMSSGVPGLPGPFSSFATSMDKELEARAEAAKLLEQHAQLTGRTTTGQPTLASQQMAQTAQIAAGSVRDPATGQMVPTLAGKKNPAEVAHLEAGSEQAQIRIKAIEQANTLHQQRLKSIDDMEFVDPNPAANAMYYQQQRAAAEVAHEAALKRLQGAGASQATPAPTGVRTWNPNLPNGGL